MLQNYSCHELLTLDSDSFIDQAICLNRFNNSLIKSNSKERFEKESNIAS